MEYASRAHSDFAQSGLDPLRDRAQETVDIVRQHGGVVVVVGVTVDRSGGAHPDFRCLFVSRVEMNVEIFPMVQIPADLAAVPAVKPGSNNRVNRVRDFDPESASQLRSSNRNSSLSPS